MKRLLAIFSVFLILSILYVTLVDQEVRNEAKEPDDLTEEDVAAGNAKDYYPFLADTLLDYQGKGNEYAERKIYFTFIEDDVAQLSMDNPGTELAQLVRHKTDKVVLTYAQEEFYYLYPLDITKQNREQILLKEPLEVGNSWEIDAGTKTITAINKDIEVPADDYQALEVTTEYEGEDSLKQLDYYVKDLGHVKSIFKAGEMNVETSLKEIREDTAKPYNIRFFYPNFEQEKLMAYNQAVEFRTNDQIKDFFLEGMRNPPQEELTRLASENTALNYIELDFENRVVAVDFSRDLVRDMQAGHFLEALIVQGIVNTFGNHYLFDNVYLTMEGQAYESGHLMLEEGEYFNVDQENIEDIELD